MKKKKTKLVKPKFKDEVTVPVCGITVALPKELVIQQTSKAEIMDSIGDIISSQIASVSSENETKRDMLPQPTEITPDLASLRAALCKITTNAWRAENKMKDSDTGAIREDLKRVYRHIESIFDGLAEAGIEKIDDTGAPYNSGMTLKVISFEPTPGLTKETIKETISPTIKWHGKLIQTGEVIIGTPQA